MRGGLVALLLIVSLVPAAMAQSPDAVQPSKESNVLFIHSGGGTLWMSTLQVDEDATDTTVNLVFFQTTSGSASFPLIPALAGPMTLDGAVDIQFNIRFGSGLVFNVGTVSTRLTNGVTVIAEAEGELAPTANSYGDVKLTAKPVVTTIDPALGDLTWTISFEGVGAAYLQASQEDQWCQLVLPILTSTAAAPANATGNATGNSTVDTNATSNATSNTTGNATQPASNKTSTAKSNTTSNTTSSTAPANDTLDSDEASTPVPAAVLLAPAVAAALLRRRRNRLDP